MKTDYICLVCDNNKSHKRKYFLTEMELDTHIENHSLADLLGFMLEKTNFPKETE